MEVAPRHKLLSPLNIIYNIFKMIAGVEVKTHTLTHNSFNAFDCVILKPTLESRKNQ